MALIKCVECGKEISDQAQACPGCGYPIKNITIEIKPQVLGEIEKIACCPNCFSDKLVTETVKNFSTSKAIVGGIALGKFGLLAGALGKITTTVTCLFCGKEHRPNQLLVIEPNQKKDLSTNLYGKGTLIKQEFYTTLATLLKNEGLNDAACYFSNENGYNYQRSEAIVRDYADRNKIKYSSGMGKLLGAWLMIFFIIGGLIGVIIYAANK